MKDQRVTPQKPAGADISNQDRAESSTSDDNGEAVRHSPPGTAAGQRSTDVDQDDTGGSPKQQTIARQAAADEAGPQVDTDCYRKLGENADEILDASTGQKSPGSDRR